MKSTVNRRAPTEQELDLVLSALADRTRRALLRQLARGPSTVTELARPFEMSLPAVSKHLRVLEGAGLLRREVDGRVHHCSIDSEPLQDVRRWLDTYRSFWEETLDALAKHAASDRPRRR